MNFWRFWNESSMWNKVGLAFVAAAVVLLIIFQLI